MTDNDQDDNEGLGQWLLAAAIVAIAIAVFAIWGNHAG
jgi:hypothetical protein